MASGALDEKVIVIVGGTAGLGLSAARTCVAAGARIVVVGRNAKDVEAAREELGEFGVAMEGDAIKSATAGKAIEVAVQRFGKLDGMYHVAGGSGRQWGDGPVHEISDEGWDRTMQLNMTALFYSNRAAAKQFLAQATGGSVLNMGSVLGYSPAPKFFATHAYAAAKSAVIGFTRACAAYYAPKSIRFNVVAPGLMATPMSQRALGNDEILKYIASKQPLDGGRIGQASDLDGAVVYLLSDAAKFVTGQVLAVDGGWGVCEGE